MSRILARSLRVLLYTLATLVILWLVLIKTPMWLTRIHAQHLLADFQSIQVNQSDWSDAQRLMHRWGRWGHYKGACTRASCSYAITIEDAPSKWLDYPIRHEWFNVTERAASLIKFIAYLGWHPTNFDITFTVADGKIVSTTSRFMIEPPPSLNSSFGDDSFPLVFTTETHSNLSTGTILYEQLGNHPDYKASTVHCTICIFYDLSYTPTLPHAQVVRLTSINLSCITRLRGCGEVDELLPAAKEWDLKSQFSSVCHVEPRARARDAFVVLEAEALSSHLIQLGESISPQPAELDRVRIIQVLKGKHKPTPNGDAFLVPFAGLSKVELSQSAEHLDPGKRYFLFLDGDIGDDPRTNDEAYPCVVLDSTPANLAQIKVGIAQDTP